MKNALIFAGGLALGFMGGFKLVTLSMSFAVTEKSPSSQVWLVRNAKTGKTEKWRVNTVNDVGLFHVEEEVKTEDAESTEAAEDSSKEFDRE